MCHGLYGLVIYIWCLLYTPGPSILSSTRRGTLYSSGMPTPQLMHLGLALTRLSAKDLSDAECSLQKLSLAVTKHSVTQLWLPPVSIAQTRLQATALNKKIKKN